MANAKHTPGPWEQNGVISARYLIGIGDVTLIRRRADGDDRYVALATVDGAGDEFSRCYTSPAEREANARLIAAAPDLLEALKALAADAKWQNTPYDLLLQARAVMDKVEGRS